MLLQPDVAHATSDCKRGSGQANCPTWSQARPSPGPAQALASQHPCGHAPVKTQACGVAWIGCPIFHEFHMKTRWLGAGVLGALLLLLMAADQPRWEVLFDGTSTAAWRAFKGKDFPAKGWVVENGTLHVQAKAGGGDIVTREQYRDFEMTFEWKVAPGANSGVMYRVSESKSASYETGPEYQVLDDSKHGDGKNPKTSASALYALIAANESKQVRPVGEWNEGRIVVQGTRIEHWLNGRKVVACDLASPEVTALIAKSKFNQWPGFAKEPAGHICLQEHGDDVWYRNIRIRKLATP